MTERFKVAIRGWIDRRFETWQRLGYHVTPVHYYQPIPDTRMIPDSVWERRSELAGIDMRLEAQTQLLKELALDFRSEYERLGRGERLGAFVLGNRSFEAVDAEIYYCLIRKMKPRRILEIGSGHSTLLAAEALARNMADGVPGELVACDPYPPQFLRGHRGVSRLLDIPGEALPVAEVDSLGAGDILFIDSTHALRIGGDVQHEYLEILPRLRPGVLVHVHDIFLPSDYPRDWVLDKHRFWTEQYLLQAFLAFNSAFEVVWAGACMRLTYPDLLSAAFQSFKPDTLPGSFWIRRV